MPEQRPYFQNVQAILFDAARKMYRAGAAADPDTDDAAGYLKRGDELRDRGFETWTVSTRDERQLYRLRAQCEANTADGRHKAAALRVALGCGSDEDRQRLDDDERRAMEGDEQRDYAEEQDQERQLREEQEAELAAEQSEPVVYDGLRRLRGRDYFTDDDGAPHDIYSGEPLEL